MAELRWTPEALDWLEDTQRYIAQDKVPKPALEKLTHTSHSMINPGKTQFRVFSTIVQ